MAIFSDFLIGLARNDGRRHQHAELPMTDTRNQTRNLPDADRIRRLAVERRSIALRFEGELRIDRIVTQTEEVSPDRVPTTVHASTGYLVDHDSRIMHLEDARCEGFEGDRRFTEVIEDRAKDGTFDWSIRRLL